MELKDVEEVVSASSTTAANALLAKGWTLLAVVGGESGPDYVFGRAKGTEPLPGKSAPAIGVMAPGRARLR
jgi:hypothetical protein